MKKTFAITALACLAALTGTAPAAAQGGHDAHHVVQTAAADTSAALSEGTVKKVDKAAGKITIAHGPLVNLDMPPMTMVFRAADAAMLEQVKAGDKIRFSAERVGGVFTVTALEVAE